MKLTILLMTAALLQVHAGAFSQNVTISGRNLSLKKIFTIIESQTGYAFFYKNELLKNARPVTIDVKNAPLESVLQLCFADQPLGYDIQNKTVFVTAPNSERAVRQNTAVLQAGDTSHIPAGAPGDGRNLPAPALKIRGQVTDEGGKAMEGGTVAVYPAGDSIPVKITSTDKKGEYRIAGLPAGQYRIRITAIGYAVSDTLVFRVGPDNRELTLGSVLLSRSGTALAGVTVTGRRPLIRQEPDRMVINVEASVTNTGATVLDVLEKSPGIMVDKDGNISLKGKSGVLVMLDGKPTYLAAADLSNLLASMNANQVDQVEIMTNPPAGYDAAGNAGIINIRTKKNRARGFNGSLSTSYGQGQYWKTNNSLNLNYRTEDYNVFFNYSFNAYRSFSYIPSHRNYLAADGKTITSQYAESIWLGRYVPTSTVKLGMDYFAGKRTTLGFVSTGFLSYRELSGHTTADLEDGIGQVDSISTNRMKDVTRWLNGTLNANLRHVFDPSRELSADLDYQTYHSTEPQLFVTTGSYPDGPVTYTSILQGFLPSDIRIYSVKADYTQTWRKQLKWGSGWKSSLVNTNNRADYDTLAASGWQPDYSRTDHFPYRENINALYTSLDYTGGRWEARGGLRFENTNYRGHQLGNPQRPDSVITRQYADLFPSLFLHYMAGGDHAFFFSAGRRIDRPSYRLLDPFIFFINQYTYQQGNPLMLPQYTTNIELGHVFKGVLTTTVNYSHTSGFFAQISLGEHDTTVIKEGNLGTLDAGGVAINAQLTLTSWWSVNLYTNLRYMHFEGNAFGAGVDNGGWALAGNGSSQWQLKKGWSAEVSGFYNSAEWNGQYHMRPFGQLSAGVSRQLMHGKATMRLSAQDILLTNIQELNAAYENVRDHVTIHKDTRVVNIAFTYRFGRTLKEPAKREGGATEEQQRVQL